MDVESTGTKKATNRVLAAPFQQLHETKGLDKNGSQRRTSSEFVDYRNFKFKPLTITSEVTFSEYVGPTPESNWVIPGVLLVGAYPASQDDEETYELITSILKERTSTFVCLQQEVCSPVFIFFPSPLLLPTLYRSIPFTITFLTSTVLLCVYSFVDRLID